MRKYANKIRKTTFQNYKKAVQSRGWEKAGICKVFEDKIVFINGSIIICAGMDGNEESLKDMEADLIIYEEAQQSLRKHYTTLANNLRAGQAGLKKSYDNQFTFQKKMIFVMNPPEDHLHYLCKMFETPELFPTILFLKSTIDNNPYATKEDYEELERIRHFDEYDYQRLRYGKALPRLEGLFFLEKKHYYFINEKQFDEITKYSDHQQKILNKEIIGTDKDNRAIEIKAKRLRKFVKVYGGDFAKGVGRDCLTLLECHIDFYYKRTIFVKDIIFDNTISDQEDIIKEMGRKNVDKISYQFWDNQYPMTINHIKGKGYPALEAVKTEILDGIEALKGFTIFICASERFTTRNPLVKQQKQQLSLKNQIPRYSRMYNEKEEYFLSKPETDKENIGIDFWDSLRYAVVSYMKTFGIK